MNKLENVFVKNRFGEVHKYDSGVTKPGIEVEWIFNGEKKSITTKDGQA